MNDRSHNARTRATDLQPRPWRLVAVCALSGAVVALALGFAGYQLASSTNDAVDTGAQNAELLAEIRSVQKQADREGRERRDQICLSAEREHLAAVTRLRRTYQYLASLKPPERAQTLNRFILRALPDTVREARIDVAPEFCDEPGEAAEKAGAPPVGLPEPDPKLPKRPRVLNR